MKRTVLTLCAALICSAGLAAESQQTGPEAPKPAPAAAAATAPTVAGNWNMSLDAGQGPMDIAVAMKLEGKKLTGTLSSQMGDTALEGEFADSKATFYISFDGGGGAMTITFVGTMKDADNMTGTMSGPMGDIPWVAKRVKG
jgi:hypothetical protein